MIFPFLSIHFTTELTAFLSVVNVTTILAHPFTLPILFIFLRLLFLGLSISKDIQTGASSSRGNQDRRRRKGRADTMRTNGKALSGSKKADESQDERKEKVLHSGYASIEEICVMTASEYDGEPNRLFRGRIVSPLVVDHELHAHSS
jgi:hypothetical protein